MMCFSKAVTSIILQPFPMVRQDHTLVTIYQYSNDFLYHWSLTLVLRLKEKKNFFINYQKIQEENLISISLFPAFSRNLFICLVLGRRYYFLGFFFFF